ncbi:TPR repeat-containing protein DDB_G0287407-like [Tubulanus polymorphus]|uniref:TPR repeat-containing protein DDB_G0287407-like n=1 Tax=Tubulanus polymorphus TaxID=672921 RepID=UPI003DA671CC
MELDSGNPGAWRTQRLKDPRVCRIFFSSPFRGMENERELFRRVYFPQIQALCRSRGIQFCPVDMRWGITTESADSARTIEICLRECDRSDIFIGYFGQRYGWHGENDATLQKNFDVASALFRWVEKYRDRSVTELEFLHGHLNNPGAMATCICFRDKSFDDKNRQEALEAGDQWEVKAYMVESEHAKSYMDDLKQRVKHSESKTIGINMAYKTPKEGVEFMFNSVWKYLNEVLLVAPPDLTPAQQEWQQHEAFKNSRCTLYVRDLNYVNEIKQHFSSGDRKLLILGESGSGKSSAISMWLNSLQSVSNSIIAYHFVGFPQHSTDKQNILFRMKSTIGKGLGIAVNDSGKDSSLDGRVSKTDQIEQYLRELQNLFDTAAENGKTIYIIIDGIDRVEDIGKTSKLLYWLPKVRSDGVFILVSTRSDDEATISELVENRKYKPLNIQPLELAQKAELCDAILTMRSKEFSTEQRKLVLQADQTSNPMFLNIMVDGLCTVGYYLHITKKIENFLEAKSIDEAFMKYLEQLDQDYNTDEFPNLVETVLTSIAIMSRGISEMQLVALFHLPSHLWSPLYFAIEKYLVLKDGLLSIGFPKLTTAIEKRYLTSKEKLQRIAGKIALYLYAEYKKTPARSFSDSMPVWIFEIPWLFLRAGKTDMLAEILLDYFCFMKLFKEEEFMVCNYWKQTQFKQEIVAVRYLNKLNELIVDCYVDQLEHYEDLSPLVPIEYVMLELMHLFDFNEWHHGKEILVRGMLHCARTSYHPLQEKLITSYMNALAICLVDQEKYDEGEILHKKVLKQCESFDATNDSEIKALSSSYHGLAVIYLRQGISDKAEEYFLKSLDVCQRLPKTLILREGALTYHNLGVVSLDQAGPLPEPDNPHLSVAIEYLEKSVQWYNEAYPGQLPPELGNALNSLAMCKRRKGDLENAKKLYEQALQISENALGSESLHVARTLSNLAVIACMENDSELALKYTLQALGIFKNSTATTWVELYNSTENAVKIMMLTNRWQEAEEQYWLTFEMLQERLKAGYNAQVIPIHGSMITHFLEAQEFEKARKVLLGMIPYNIGEDIHYLQLIQIDRKLDSKIERSYQYTIDAGLERFPESDYLIRGKMEFELLPTGDSDVVVSFLKSSVYSEKPAVFPQLFDFIMGAELPDIAISVLQYGHDKHPDNQHILGKLVDTYRVQKNYSMAVKYLLKLIEFTQDAHNMSLAIRFACSSGDLDTARRVYERGIHLFAADEESLKQIEETYQVIIKTEKFIEDYKSAHPEEFHSGS